jgi:hypothetical protein
MGLEDAREVGLALSGMEARAPYSSQLLPAFTKRIDSLRRRADRKGAQPIILCCHEASGTDFDRRRL